MIREMAASGCAAGCTVGCGGFQDGRWQGCGGLMVGRMVANRGVKL